MATFPALSTGAVAQYPVKTTTNYKADIVWFLDGSEQRFRNAPSTLYQWEINLAKLDEQEMAAIEQFFLANEGPASTFAFTDPSSGVAYQNCSVLNNELLLTSVAPLSGNTTITIRENRT